MRMVSYFFFLIYFANSLNFENKQVVNETSLKELMEVSPF